MAAVAAKRKVAMPAGDELKPKKETCSTPIADFVDEYVKKQAVRAHMPGHKGSVYGSFATDMDITEISGADSLYEADGIILESENNASVLFGDKHSFYVTEGSSQAIKAMCLLAIRMSMRKPENEKNGLPDISRKKPVIIAGRNAHRSFVSAAELLGFEVEWLVGENRASLMECRVTPEILEEKLQEAGFCDKDSEEKHPNDKPGKFLAGIYITSPDYLGNMADIKALTEVAHRHGTYLLVDNAHGSYLKFLKKDMHPITLGADLVCDSAHKTLPVLTGGAYLHVSKRLKDDFDMTEVRQALLRFGSTSPSYLILRSLDLANAFLEKCAGERHFDKCCERISEIKGICSEKGLVFSGDEPMKICVDLAASGLKKARETKEYDSEKGTDAGDILRNMEIEPEFADRDFLILMLSPLNGPEDFDKAEQALLKLAEKAEKPSGIMTENAFTDNCIRDFSIPVNKHNPSEMIFWPRVKVKTEDAKGRIAADVPVSCPPAILPVIPGEAVDENIIKILQYYGIKEIYVKQ